MTELMAQLVGTWLKFLGWEVEIRAWNPVGPDHPPTHYHVVIIGEREEGRARIC